MKNQNVIIFLCFTVAIGCALAMLPLSTQLVTQSSASPPPDSVKDVKWLLACALGIVGLTSALTGKRLSDRNSNL